MIETEQKMEIGPTFVKKERASIWTKIISDLARKKIKSVYQKDKFTIKLTMESPDFAEKVKKVVPQKVTKVIYENPRMQQIKQVKLISTSFSKKTNNLCIRYFVMYPIRISKKWFEQKN
jgi:hypothetical protein